MLVWLGLSCVLFANIDDKKISGSDVAGYSGEQTVF